MEGSLLGSELKVSPPIRPVTLPNSYLFVSPSMKPGITGTTLKQCGRVYAWPARSKHSVDSVLPWSPLLFLCLALD